MRFPRPISWLYHWDETSISLLIEQLPIIEKIFILNVGNIPIGEFTYTDCFWNSTPGGLLFVGFFSKLQQQKRPKYPFRPILEDKYITYCIPIWKNISHWLNIQHHISHRIPIYNHIRKWIPLHHQNFWILPIFRWHAINQEVTMTEICLFFTTGF